MVTQNSPQRQASRAFGFVGCDPEPCLRHAEHLAQGWQKLVVFENGQFRRQWCVPPDFNGLARVKKGCAVIVWLRGDGCAERVELAHPPN